MGGSTFKSFISFSFWVLCLPNNDGIIDSLKHEAPRIDAFSRDHDILSQGETGPQDGSARAWMGHWEVTSLSEAPGLTAPVHPDCCLLEISASDRLPASLWFVRWDTLESCTVPLWAESPLPSDTLVQVRPWPHSSQVVLFPYKDRFSISTLQETEITANLTSTRAMNLLASILWPSEVHLVPQGHSEWTTGS